MYPDRMEVVNPGLLPLGVTPDNILQKRVKRNEHLARLCYALHLMEGEGSGYDLMYETLLTAGKSRPLTYEGTDFVKVVIERKIYNQEVAHLCDYVISNYPTTQKGRIALGIILNEKKITAAKMSSMLQLQMGDKLGNYIGRLYNVPQISDSELSQKLTLSLHRYGKDNTKKIYPGVQGQGCFGGSKRIVNQG